ncbi:hypothetical protein BU16DRAFT_282619 [Lophium mytilinum]|uniref:Uncharacterized protein n=1 Tax=Lophium mytilinum TaxID=390894 RepID=A0A6A6R7P7_9PEZI|nr:hypothetical protein BU16DRAFT_282619 [Lophium mytilinum]
MSSYVVQETPYREMLLRCGSAVSPDRRGHLGISIRHYPEPRTMRGMDRRFCLTSCMSEPARRSAILFLLVPRVPVCRIHEYASLKTSGLSQAHPRSWTCSKSEASI